VTFKELYQKIAGIYAQYFIDNGKDKGYELLLSKDFPLSILNSLYRTFINEGVPELSTIPQEEKSRIWKLALKYQTENQKRIEASRAAYVLSLITNE
jgi:hypothetical protein